MCTVLLELGEKIEGKRRADKQPLPHIVAASGKKLSSRHNHRRHALHRAGRTLVPHAKRAATRDVLVSTQDILTVSSVLLKDSDNVFSSYDGAKGTTLDAENANIQPLNLSLAFPRSAPSGNEHGPYVVSDGSVTLRASVSVTNEAHIRAEFVFEDVFGTRCKATVAVAAVRESGRQFRAVSGSLDAEGFGQFNVSSAEQVKLFTIDSRFFFFFFFFFF